MSRWINNLNDSFQQISSLTGQIGGQISSITKEVLTDQNDAEPSSDKEADIKQLKLKLNELEAFANEKEAEVMKQVKMNADLRNEARNADVELSRCEQKIKEQNVLIDKLKRGLLVETGHDDNGFHVVSSDNHPSSRFTPRSDSESYDDHVTADDARLEVARNASELRKVEEECRRWKQLANQQTASSASASSSSDTDKTKLELHVQELEGKLRDQVDQHQHELLMLQDANAITIKRYKNQIKLLSEQQNNVSANDATEDGSTSSVNATSPRSNDSQIVSKLNAEVEQLNEKLRTRNRQLQAHKQTIEQMRREQAAAAAAAAADNSGDGDKRSDSRRSLDALVSDLRELLPDLFDSSDFTDQPDDVITKEIYDGVKELWELFCWLQVEQSPSGDGENDDDDSKSSQLSPNDSESNESKKFRVESRMRIQPPMYQSSPMPPHRTPQQQAESEEKFVLVSAATDDDESVDDDTSPILPPPNRDSPTTDLATLLVKMKEQTIGTERDMVEFRKVQRQWKIEKRNVEHVLDQFYGRKPRGPDGKITIPSRVHDNKDGYDGGDDKMARDEMMTSQLTHELDEMKVVCEEMETEKQRLIQEQEELRHTADKLEAKLNESICQFGAEKEKVSELRSELDVAVMEKSEMEAAVSKLSAELEQTKAEKTDLDEALTSLDAQHQEEMSQLLQLRSQFDSRLKDMDSQLSTAKKKNAELASAADDLKAELAEMQLRSSEQIVSLEERRAELEERRAQLEERNKHLQARLQDTQTLLASSEDRERDAEEQLGRLRLEVEETRGEWDAERASMEERVGDLQTRVEGTELKLVKLREQLGRDEDAQKQDRGEREGLEEELRATVLKLEESGCQLVQAEHRLLSTVKSKEEEVATLRSEMEGLGCELDNALVLNSEKDQLKIAADADAELKLEKIGHLEEQLEESRSEAKQTKARMEKQLSDVHDTLGAELQKVLSALKESCGEKSRLSELLLLKEEECARQKEDHLALSSELDVLRNENLLEITSFHEAKMATVAAQLEESTKLYDEVRVEMSANQELSQREVSRLTDDLEKVKMKLENRELALQDKLVADESKRIMADKLEDQTMRIEQMHTEKRLLKDRVLSITDEKKAAEDELDRVSQSLSAQIETLSHEQQALEEEILCLKQENELIEHNRQMLESEKERWRNENEELLRIQDELKASNEEWTDGMVEELRRLEEIKSALELERDAILDKHKHLERTSSLEIQARGADCEKLRAEFHESKETSARLRDQVEELASRERDLQEEVKRWQRDSQAEDARRAELESELQRAREEAAAVKAESERVAAENDKLRAVSDAGGAGHLKATASVEQMLEDLRAKDLSGLEKADLCKDDIGSLLDLIKERDVVIDRLRDKNAMLSATSNQPEVKVSAESRDKSEEEENGKKMLIQEKDQMLAVISDKTRENRQLKDETQRMIDVIAAGKNALQKVQEENRELRAKYEGYDREMTKETVSRLSKLISEKDLELESLRQKCQTLLDVLHQQETRESASQQDSTSASHQQVEALLKDRDTLNAQVRQLLTERDQLVALVNSKHQQAVEFRDEAEKACAVLERDSATNSQLQVAYGNLVHDHEQLEMKLGAVRRELAAVKEGFNHLQECKELLLAKLTEASPGDQLPADRRVHDVTQLTSDSSEPRSREELESILEKKSESLLQKDLLVQDAMKRATTSNAKVEQLKEEMREKDAMMVEKTEELSQLHNRLARVDNENSILKKSVENLREQLASVNCEADLLRKRVDDFSQSVREKQSETEAFQETNAQLTMMLKQHEYEREDLKDKVGKLEDILKQHEEGKETESQKYLSEVDRARKESAGARHERDQLMLTLKQKQMETSRSHEEVRHLRDKEGKLQSELARLRSHLVQVEETYTQEALLGEERERQLRARLEHTHTANETAREQGEISRQQVDTLQEQLGAVRAQRDQAQQQFQVVQEQNGQYAAALTQLKQAAERMQRDEAATFAARVLKIEQKLQEKTREVEARTRQAAELQAKLSEVGEALELASRLSGQLESKEDDLLRATEIVSEKQQVIDELNERLHSVKSRNENMVDRQLVKNLLIGYFSSAPGKKDDVMRLITSVIGFSKEESVKLNPPKRGWVGGWLSWRPGEESLKSVEHHKSGDLNESFTEMFVKFLESESVSKQSHAKLPTTAMVNEQHQRSEQRKFAATGIPTPAHNPPTQTERGVAGRYNPPLIISNPATLTTGLGGASSMTSSTAAHPFMQPVAMPRFAAPMSQPKSSSERDYLKGILQNDGDQLS